MTKVGELRYLFFTFSIVILSISLPGRSLTALGIDPAATPFGNYHLAISMGEDEQYKDGDFWVILNHEQTNIEALQGEPFTLVTPEGKLLGAKLTGSHPTDLVSNLARYPIGKLKLTDKGNSYEVSPRRHMLAIQNGKPEAQLVGRVMDVEDTDSLYKMISVRIKKDLPEEMKVYLPTLQRIHAPGAGADFLFVGAEYFDPEEYRKAGDHALHRTCYLFKVEAAKPVARVKMSDELVSEVYSITDLNEDGIWELLVGTNTGFDGTYEIRLLNHRRLSASRTKLYEWGH